MAAVADSENESGGGVVFLGGVGGVPEDWSGVRDRVIAVQQARGRMYPAFERVLTFDELDEVEAEAGISLPDEYAAFLTEVGTGGPGPELELTTLCQTDGRWAWVWPSSGVPSVLDATGPFLENEEWLKRQVETLRAAGHEPGARDEQTGYSDAYCKAFGDLEGNRLFYEQRFRGAIQISDDGCSMTNWLVIVGPHRGGIWFRDCGYDPPLEPLLDASGKPHTFYTWYIDWLERNETRVGLRPAGTNPATPPGSR